jgi:hypothetical protein
MSSTASAAGPASCEIAWTLHTNFSPRRLGLPGPCLKTFDASSEYTPSLMK